MKQIFSLIAYSLYTMAKWFKLTYNEINIIVYYFIIPLSWAIMIDYLIGKLLLTEIVFCIWVGILIANRHTFEIWCDWAFEDSVKFLKWFKHIGWNYIVASVIICVFVPICVYAILIYLLI